MSPYMKAYHRGRELAKLASMSKLANPFGGGRNPFEFDYKREPMPKRQANPSTKRKRVGGVTLPSDKDIQGSTGDMMTVGLEGIKNIPAPIRNLIFSRRERDAMGEEYIRRRKGDPGNFSTDLSTMQRDVDRLGDYIAGNYTPKLPKKTVSSIDGTEYYYPNSVEQDKNPLQGKDYTSDQTRRMFQTGDLREGIRFGRLPANVIRPSYLRHYSAEGDKQTVRPLYGPTIFNDRNYEGDIHRLGPRYVPNQAATSSLHRLLGGGDTFASEHVNPSSYLMEATANPRDPSKGYINPVIAAHEYAHGEYGMDEVEADALAATSDYDMYDLADMYNRLTEYGDEDDRTKLTREDHERVGDTHLPLSERIQLLADNVSTLGK